MDFVKGPNLVHLGMMKRKEAEKMSIGFFFQYNKNNLELTANISNHKDLKESGI